MRAANERAILERPKPWVVKMEEERGIGVAEKTMYWLSVHLERFLKFCRGAGAESSGVLEVVVRLFLESCGRRTATGLCQITGAGGVKCFSGGDESLVLGEGSAWATL